MTQTWKATWTETFPKVIELVLPPIRSIESIVYLDPDGAQQTLDPSDYRVTGLGGWLTEITPAAGRTWPSTQCVREAVTVTFVSGYGDDADDVPPQLRQAIRFLIGHWYENRSAVERSTFVTSFAEVPLTVQELLRPFRVYRRHEVA